MYHEIISFSSTQVVYIYIYRQTNKKHKDVRERTIIGVF